MRGLPLSARLTPWLACGELGVGAKGSLITTLVMTPGGHERLARATLVVTRGPVLRLPRQGVACHGLERLCVAQR